MEIHYGIDYNMDLYTCLGIHSSQTISNFT